MSLHAFNYGVNIVALSKNNHNYGMTCSWAMQVDYDKVCLLLGEQSITGKMIKKGDKVGVSSLNSNQVEIAKIFGEGHSDKIDKFYNINFKASDQAITINEARVRMIVEVIDVLKLKGIENDNLVYGKIISVEKEKDTHFLTLQTLS